MEAVDAGDDALLMVLRVDGATSHVDCSTFLLVQLIDGAT